MPIGITTATVVGLATAGGTAAAGVYAAKKQASSARTAADITSRSSADQLAYLKEQAAQAQKNYDATALEDKRRYDEQIAEQKREFETTAASSADLARKRFEAGAPYRALGGSAANTMGAILAKHFGGPAPSGGGMPAPSGPPPSTVPGPEADPRQYAGRSPSPVSSYGPMPTQTMGDLLSPDAPAADLARPGSMGDIVAPYVYLPDASGRMVPVPRAMAPRGVRV